MQDLVREASNDRRSLASRNLVMLELMAEEGLVSLLVFFARDFRLRAAVQGRREAVDRPCLCPRDVLERVC
jgi:hypothetical protein